MMSQSPCDPQKPAGRVLTVCQKPGEQHLNLPKIAVVVGLLLLIQGIGFFVATGSKSPTALIPSGVGLPVLLLGLLAFQPNLRKLTMHIAAALGVLGLLAALGRIATAGLHWTPAGVSLSLMVLLCGLFVALCVQSFIAARRRQRAVGT